VPVDVLHHDDGVVHEDADGEDEREQRHAVEREAAPSSERVTVATIRAVLSVAKEMSARSRT
jgi:hypothetical protein